MDHEEVLTEIAGTLKFTYYEDMTFIEKKIARILVSAGIGYWEDDEDVLNDTKMKAFRVLA